MAYTATLLKNNIMGNQRVAMYSVAADAASGSVATPCGFIDAAIISPISMTTSGIKVKVNTTVASAVANGTVFISSAASTDVFYLTVYGH
jgi:hypothetical protein